MMAEVEPAVLKRLLSELGQVKESAQRHLSEED